MQLIKSFSWIYLPYEVNLVLMLLCLVNTYIFLGGHYLIADKDSWEKSRASISSCIGS